MFELLCMRTSREKLINIGKVRNQIIYFILTKVIKKLIYLCPLILVSTQKYLNLVKCSCKKEGITSLVFDFCVSHRRLFVNLYINFSLLSSKSGDKTAR